MTVKKLAQLGKLTDAAFLAEQAKLARLTRQEADLRAQIAQLAAARNGTADRLRDGSDPALQAGADVRWHQWIAVRQTRLNEELLQILTRKARQIDAVRRAHGRAQALDQLTDQARDAARRKRDAQEQSRT